LPWFCYLGAERFVELENNRTQVLIFAKDPGARREEKEAKALFEELS